MPAISWTMPDAKHSNTVKSGLVPLVYVNVRRDNSAVGPMLICGHVPITAYTNPPTNDA